MSSTTPNDDQNNSKCKADGEHPEDPNSNKKNIIPSDESPFGKTGNFKLVDSDEESDSEDDSGEKARFIIIKPNGKKVMHGFVMYMEGYSDKHLGNIMFGKGKNDNNFKKALKLVRRVVHPLGVDGKELKNPREFPYRGIIVLAKPGTVITPEDCVNWYNNAFIGPFKKMTAGLLAGDKYPVPELTTNIRTNWTSAVPIAHMDFVLRHYSFMINEDKPIGTSGRSALFNVTNYIKDGKDQLYSIFPEGSLTKKLVRTYNIAQKHMSKLDVDTLAAAAKLKAEKNAPTGATEENKEDSSTKETAKKDV